MAEQGSTVVRITANSQYHYASTRQAELDKVLNQLNKESKRVVNIIDGPLTRLSPFDTVVCDVTILWEIQEKPELKVAPRVDGISSQTLRPAVSLNVTADNFNSVLTRTDLFLEDGEWDLADAYCEQALNHDVTNAEIYVRKLMAELHIPSRGDLKNVQEPIHTRKNYQLAFRFADNDLKNELETYSKTIGLKINAQIDSLINAMRKHDQTQIEGLIQEYQDTAAILSYLLSRFDSIIGTISALREEIGKHEKDKQRLLERRKTLGLFSGKEKKQIDAQVAELNLKMDELQEKVCSTEGELQSHESKSELEDELKTLQEEIISANAKLIELKKIQPGLSYQEAYTIITSGSFISKKLRDEHPQFYFRYFEKGDELKFGRYASEANADLDKPETFSPIEWVVCHKTDKELILITKYLIESLPYSCHGDCGWEDTEVRLWLNQAFYNVAFTSKEKELMKTHFCDNEDDAPRSDGPNQGKVLGHATADKVFLLSKSEAEQYFPNNQAKICYPTEHGKVRGLGKFDGVDYWRLRTHSADSKCVCSVDYKGKIHNTCWMDNYSGIRPAICINIELR